jgi:ribose/xylose/arabinose/galactoside ABC-type transport system permease subunit
MKEEKSAETVAASSSRGINVQKLIKTLSKYGLWWVFLGLLVLASLLSPYFLTYRNISNVIRQISIMGVMAVGMTFVILIGGIDLGVGGVMALSCVLVAVMLPIVKGSAFLTILTCLLTGTVFGALAGLITAYGGLQPFITTLGMSSITEGLGFMLTNGNPIILQDMRWGNFGNGYTWVFPNLALIFIGVVAIGQIVLSKTVFGTYLYSIGGNEEATRLSGIKTKRYKLAAFTISGFLAAVGGVMMTTRISVGDPGVGSSYALDVIACVVVGGTRMGGGYGSVINTLLGASIMGVLNNVFNLLNISPYPQMIFKGVIIIGAVLLEELRKKREK